MNSNNKTNSVSVVDEFGRDTSLRNTKTNVEAVTDFSEEITRRFKGKSWAEVNWELEEEEEERQQRKSQVLSPSAQLAIKRRLK